MKKIFFFLACLISIPAFNQGSSKIIPLTFNKTVHLFFEDNISYVDAGLEDILWKNDGNMLKLATRIENFEETNLVVMTTDGKAYGFTLRYAKDNDTLIYNIPSTLGVSVKTNKQALEQNSQIDSLMEQKKIFFDYDKNSQIAIKKKQKIYGTDQVADNVYVALTNIFVFNDKLYFSFKAINKSNIAFDVEKYDLELKDKRKAKKSSFQPISIDVIYQYNKFDKLPENFSKDIVLVTEKFTVAKDKKLYFSMIEQNGGRDILFYIDKNLLAKAPALIDF